MPVGGVHAIVMLAELEYMSPAIGRPIEIENHDCPFNALACDTLSGFWPRFVTTIDRLVEIGTSPNDTPATGAGSDENTGFASDEHDRV